MSYIFIELLPVLTATEMEEIEYLGLLSSELGPLVVRLCVAAVCGLMLGVERERKDKPAGLRTITLISVGSALLMILSNLVPFAFDWPELARIDPSRIAAGVVTGIGFLGAGTIIRSSGSVQGLTTAAVIWVASAVGMCAGIGYIELSFLFTGLVVFVLVAMDPLHKLVGRFGRRHEITAITPNDSLTLDRIRYLLLGHDVRERDVRVHAENDRELHVSFVYHGYNGAVLRLLEALASIDGVRGLPVATEDVDTR